MPLTCASQLRHRPSHSPCLTLPPPAPLLAPQREACADAVRALFSGPMPHLLRHALDPLSSCARSVVAEFGRQVRPGCFLLLLLAGLRRAGRSPGQLETTAAVGLAAVRAAGHSLLPPRSLPGRAAQVRRMKGSWGLRGVGEVVPQADGVAEV